MKRSNFLHLTALAPPVEAPPLLGDLSPYEGEWGMLEITHLLRRTLFGATLEDIRYFQERTLEETLDELLSPSAIVPPIPVNNYNDRQFIDPDVPFGETWIHAPFSDDAEPGRIWSLKGWWMHNMMTQDRSIHEKMILFWFNHIPIQFYEVFFARWDYLYIEMLRKQALGDVKSIVKAITLSPAMLHFLSGQYNHKDAPDENYGRELQELYCIGKGPNSQYTERDVQAAAKILTGWRTNYENDEHYFDEEAHDTSNKAFSAFYNNRIIMGREGAAGAEELDELLDMIFDNDECALFICRKLYRFFVYQGIDDWTEENIIAPLAETLRTSNYEIVPVLRQLFGSQHFFDFLRQGTIIKSPLDFIVSLCREFNAPIPPAEMLQDRYDFYGNLVYMSYIFDQDLGDPPNVAGWQAYHQIPNFDKSWITTNTLPNRASFVDWILWVGISTPNFLSQLNILGTVAKIAEALDPNELIDFMLKWQYPIEVDKTFHEQLREILLSGQTQDYYWTTAWYEYLAQPDDEMKRATVLNRLLPFFYTIFHQEEHQLS